MSIGVSVTTRTAPAAKGAATATDTLFVVGPSTVVGAVSECRSLADFVAVHGVRASGNQSLYDYVDTFFREGGKKAYVSGYATNAYAGALALFTADYGPGQVAIADPAITPGATPYGALLTHAATFNRFALMDVESDSTAGEMATLGAAIPSTNADYGMAVGPWVTVPAPLGVTGGTARSVPASAVVAGLIARADASGNPNRAAAGRDFPLQYATGLALTVTDAERLTALNAGVNTFADKYGILQLYGFQTKIAQSDSTPFWQANTSRARMWLKAHAEVIGEDFMFKPLDGRGHLAGQLKSRLEAVCKRLYNADGLYGNTEAEAFAVDVGEAVNTVDDVAAGELNAVVEARLSLHARTVLIELVSVPVTGTVLA